VKLDLFAAKLKIIKNYEVFEEQQISKEWILRMSAIRKLLKDYQK
jgi:hypothetical protein